MPSITSLHSGVKPGSAPGTPCPLSEPCNDCEAEAAWLDIEGRLADPDARRGRALLDSGDLAEPYEAPCTADDRDWEDRRSSAYSAGWDDARRGEPRRDPDGYAGYEWLAYLRGRSHCLATLADEIDAADERTVLDEPGGEPGVDWAESERVAVLGSRAYGGRDD